MTEINSQSIADSQTPNRLIQNFCDTEKPCKHYQQVFKEDIGKGYKAIDIISNLAYLFTLILLLYVLWISIHAPLFLIQLVAFPLYFLTIYLTRLLVRAVLAWRDKLADEIIE
jgi:hypothetical protein